jgi:hypothetical protein
MYIKIENELIANIDPAHNGRYGINGAVDPSHSGASPGLVQNAYIGILKMVEGISNVPITKANTIFFPLKCILVIT